MAHLGENRAPVPSGVLYTVPAALDESLEPLQGARRGALDEEDLPVLPHHRNPNHRGHLLVERRELAEPGWSGRFHVRRGHELEPDLQAAVVHYPDRRLA